MRKIKIIGMMVLVVGIVCFGFSQFTQALYQEDGAKKQRQKEGLYLAEQGRLTPSSINQIIQEGKPGDLEKITQPEYAPGEVIVKFKPDIVNIPLEKQEVSASEASINVSSIQSLNQKYGLIKMKRVFKPQLKRDHYGRISLMSPEEQAESIRQKFPQRAARAPRDAKIPDLTNIYKLTFSKETNVLKIVEEYKKDPNVEYAQPNYKMELYTIPNDPYYSSSGSWGQAYEDMWGLHKIEASQAWDKEKGSDKVTVAVIDTGIDYNHEDLADNVWINTDEIPDNGIDDDNNGYIDDYYGYDFSDSDKDPSDYYGHGTHCAGTIAAVTNNSKGVAGISWYSKIMSVKIFPNAYEDVIVKAIEYAADNGADVLSNSWGPTGRLPSNPVIEDAVRYAYNSGCVVVFAAGNNMDDVQYYSPANMFETIAVAATDPNDKRASFSNYGSLIDVSAPGVDVLSLRAEGTDMYGDEKQIVGEKYYRADGTSMACPHVAGLAALLLSKKSDWNPEEARRIIAQAADKPGIDMPIPDKYIGTGRINAYKALQIDSISDAVIEITYPKPDSKVSGYIDIKGTAKDDNFKYYRLSYGEGIYPMFYTLICSSVTPVDNGILCSNFDTTQLEEDAVYTLLLTADDTDGLSASDRVMITVNNVEVTSPLNNDVFRLGDTLEIKGTLPADSSYIVEYGLGHEPSEWYRNGITLGSGGVDVTLATWDTSVVTEAGFYTIRLTLDYNGSQIYEYIRNIYLDPTLKEGWPKKIAESSYYWEGYIEPVVSDIDKDGKEEIIVYVGGNPTKIYIFKEDGTLSGCPIEVNGVDLPGGLPAPSVADIDKDGYKEILVNGLREFYIYNYDGALKTKISLPSEGRSDKRTEIVIADLNNDGSFEIIYQWRQWGGDFGKTGEVIAVFDSQGNMLPGWPQLYYDTEHEGSSYWCGASFESTLAVGNFDADLEKEILVAGLRNVFDPDWHCEGRIHVYNLDGSTVPGFPVDIDGKIFSSPAIGDVNYDGNDEIVVASMESKNPNSGIYIIDRSGQIMSGWPKLIGEDVWTSPALADFNNDGYLEIVVSTIGVPFNTYLFDYQGNILSGWPKTTVWNNYRSPIIGDVNGDGVPDILTTAGNGIPPYTGGVYAWNFNGTTIEGFPKVTEVDAQAAATIADIDNDGKVELVASSDLDYDFEKGDYKKRGTIYVWELNKEHNPETMHWPMFHHDPQHTGYYTSLNHPPILDTIGNKTVDEGKLLQFTVSATDPDGDSLTYSAINLPKGATFTSQTFSWTPDYTQAGTYNVTFKVEDGKGGQDSEDITITVNDVNRAPVARIRAYPKSGYSSLKVQFFGAQSFDPDGDKIVSYFWDFGDGGTSSLINPVHYFYNNSRQIKVYKVRLTVKDSKGASSTGSTLITVYPRRRR